MFAPHSRREFFRSVKHGLFGASLAGLTMSGRLHAGETEAAGPVPHHPPRAKRCIFLFMHGGPSQVDTFDYKPRLQAEDGQKLPFERPANIDAAPTLLKSPWSFKQYGERGQWVSELFPHLAQRVDELCFVHSVHSRGQSHGQAVSMLHTGSDNLVRPSLGAWVSYGLGAETESLPAFVSIAPSAGHGGPRNYGSAFLPAIHQATTIGRQGKIGKSTIAHLLTDPARAEAQRSQVELMQALNRDYLERGGPDALVQGAIDANELAFRMQAAAPEVLDLSRESAETQASYGIGEKETDDFGRQCLLAVRLVESGVRFVELSTGNVWDQHGGLKGGHEKNARATDRPIVAMLDDLTRRGLLDDTLVVWGGEFGRTPIAQGKDGRDHNPQGFTVWLAGGGVKAGIAYGATDEYGYFATENRVHMHDLHATILHLMGIDHTRLTYRYAGRDFRLTDVHGEVVNGILA